MTSSKHSTALVFTVLTLFAVVGLFAGMGLYVWSQPRTWAETSLWVRSGWGQGAIAGEVARLADLPALPLQAALRLAATRPLHAGEYDLSDQPSPAALVARMQDGAVIKRQVTIPEGLTSHQIVAVLKKAFGLTDDCPAPDTLAQGTLLPETYAYVRGEACTGVLARMKALMDAELAQEWAQRDPTVPYASPQEAVTMASIVERETGLPQERARVAGVFVNRLRLGMPMQSDPTTIYALSNGTGDLGRLLTRADWKVVHPYNTYTIPALPPGPIAHPGRESLRAALHPETHEFLFFVTKPGGGHAFAKTLDSHNQNVAKK